MARPTNFVVPQGLNVAVEKALTFLKNSDRSYINHRVLKAELNVDKGISFILSGDYVRFNGQCVQNALDKAGLTGSFFIQTVTGGGWAIKVPEKVVRNFTDPYAPTPPQSPYGNLSGRNLLSKSFPKQFVIYFALGLVTVTLYAIAQTCLGITSERVEKQEFDTVGGTSSAPINLLDLPFTFARLFFTNFTNTVLAVLTFIPNLLGLLKQKN